MKFNNIVVRLCLEWDGRINSWYCLPSKSRPRDGNIKGLSSRWIKNMIIPYVPIFSYRSTVVRWGKFLMEVSLNVSCLSFKLLRNICLTFGWTYRRWWWSKGLPVIFVASNHTIFYFVTTCTHMFSSTHHHKEIHNYSLTIIRYLAEVCGWILSLIVCQI